MKGLASTDTTPVPIPPLAACSFYQSLEPQAGGGAACKVTPWSVVLAPVKLLEMVVPQLSPEHGGSEFLEVAIAAAAWWAIFYFAWPKRK